MEIRFTYKKRFASVWKIMKIQSCLCFLILLAFFSCKKSSSPCELSDEILQVPIEVKIERIETKLFETTDTADILWVMEEHPEFTRQYLQENLYESRKELAAELLQINQDSAMQELYGEVMLHFPDISEVEKELENAFKYIRYYFPEFKIPKVYTMVSGFNSDLLISEDVIVIGLDYFCPKNINSNLWISPNTSPNAIKKTTSFPPSS